MVDVLWFPFKPTPEGVPSKTHTHANTHTHMQNTHTDTQMRQVLGHSINPWRVETSKPQQHRHPLNGDGNQRRFQVLRVLNSGIILVANFCVLFCFFFFLFFFIKFWHCLSKAHKDRQSPQDALSSHEGFRQGRPLKPAQS